MTQYASKWLWTIAQHAVVIAARTNRDRPRAEKWESDWIGGQYREHLFQDDNTMWDHHQKILFLAMSPGLMVHSSLVCQSHTPLVNSLIGEHFLSAVDCAHASKSIRDDIQFLLSVLLCQNYEFVSNESYCCTSVKDMRCNKITHS